MAAFLPHALLHSAHNTQMPLRDDGKPGLRGSVGVFLGILHHFWPLVAL